MSDIAVMYIRDAQPEETMQLWQLFHDTIHNVSGAHYSPEQQLAWAPHSPDESAWRARMTATRPFVAVAEKAGKAHIVGFSDLQDDGLVDFLFVHHRWQGRGVASLLLREVELRAKEARMPRLHSFVSLTAEPVFRHFGFTLDYRQRLQVRGVELPNCHMIKLRQVP
ncbi:MAG: GNAT family N-acetyltransferase [Pseudomonadota bacterium]